MPCVFNLHFILELIIDRFDQEPFTKQDFVQIRHELVFHIRLDGSNQPEFRLSGVEKWRRCERSAAIQASVRAFASLEHANSPFKKSGLLPASQARGRNDAAGRCS